MSAPARVRSDNALSVMWILKRERLSFCFEADAVCLRVRDGHGNVRLLGEEADCTRRHIEAERCTGRRSGEGHRIPVGLYRYASGERLLGVPPGGHGTANGRG